MRSLLLAAAAAMALAGGAQADGFFAGGVAQGYADAEARELDRRYGTDYYHQRQQLRRLQQLNEQIERNRRLLEEMNQRSLDRQFR